MIDIFYVNNMKTLYRLVRDYGGDFVWAIPVDKQEEWEEAQMKKEYPEWAIYVESEWKVEFYLD